MNGYRYNMALPSRHRDTLIFTFLLVIFCCLQCGDLMAQSIRPAVQVLFHIEGDLFRQTDAQKAEIEEKVVEKVCTDAAHRWGFLDWCATPPDELPAAVWIVKLTVAAQQQTLPDGDIHETEIVHIHHTLKMDGEEIDLHRVILYDYYETKETQDADRLQRDILKKLDDPSDSFSQLLQSDEVEAALTRIPVAHQLELDEEAQKIVVPLRLREDLRAEEETEFKVVLITKNDGMSRFKLKEAGEHNGKVLGKIIVWDVHPSVWVSNVSSSSELPNLTNFPWPFWIDRLPELIGEMRSVNVLLSDYKPSLSGADTSFDGIITTAPGEEEVQ